MMALPTLLPAYELPRTQILGTSVNKGKKRKGENPNGKAKGT
jgi:hypothetical protein